MNNIIRAESVKSSINVWLSDTIHKNKLGIHCKLIKNSYTQEESSINLKLNLKLLNSDRKQIAIYKLLSKYFANDNIVNCQRK